MSFPLPGLGDYAPIKVGSVPTPTFTRNPGVKMYSFRRCIPYNVWERLPRDDRPLLWCPILADLPEGSVMSWEIAAENASVAEVSVQADYAGQVCINRWFYRIQAGTGPFTSGMLLDGVKALWRTNILPLVSVDLTVRYYVAKLMRPLEIPVGHFDYQYADIALGTVLDVGGASGDPAPAFVVATAQLKTNTIGRSFRGSKRISGLLDSDTKPTDPNYLTAAAHTVLQPAAQAVWMTPINDIPTLGVAVPVVASNVIGAGFVPTNTSTWFIWSAIINDVIVNTRLGSQVSRKTRGAS